MAQNSVTKEINYKATFQSDWASATGKLFGGFIYLRWKDEPMPVSVLPKAKVQAILPDFFRDIIFVLNAKQESFKVFGKPSFQDIGMILSKFEPITRCNRNIP